MDSLNHLNEGSIYNNPNNLQKGIARKITSLEKTNSIRPGPLMGLF